MELQLSFLYPDRESLYLGIRLIFNKLPLIITLKGVGKV